MTKTRQTKPRVFVDADVLFAGAASPTDEGASLMVLRLAEITLIEAVVSQQVIVESERNLALKLPSVLPAFRLIVNRSLRIVSNPDWPTLQSYAGLVDPKDLPLLVTALREDCRWLVTFNLRHYQPGHPSVKVLRPGDFIMLVREQLGSLASR